MTDNITIALDTTTNAKQKAPELPAHVKLSVNHSTHLSHSESGWEAIKMASVFKDSSIEAANVDGGGAYKVQKFADAEKYVEAFAQSMDASLNDPEFFDLLNEKMTAEVRPFRTHPTPVQYALLADASVPFNPRNRYADDKDKPTTTVKFGEMVSVEPAETAIMFNHSVRLYDLNMETSGFTAHSLQNTVIQALVDVSASMTAQAATILDGSSYVRKTTAAKPTGSPREQAEDIIDILAVAVSEQSAFGVTLDEYCLLLPQSLEAILNRAAQRAGVQGVEELLGCGVMPYSGADRGLFLLPKRFNALSFRTHRNGDAFPVEMTRDAAHGAWIVEMRGVVDMVCDASTKDESGKTISLPTVAQIVLTSDSTK